MLEPVRSMTTVRERGFTIIELLAVTVIVVILLALAIPSWRDTAARKRVEGLFVELQADLEYARSEAAARNAVVQVSFGSGCYVAHLASAAASCTATTKSVTPPEGELKSQLLGSSPQVSITQHDALTRINFEPTRGIASWDGSGAQAGLSLASTSGSWQLTVTLSAVGRVNVCSPGGSIKGYPPC
jgi:prepilin-type N-terminal cleavage/methylation domain-containing protein